MKKFVRLPTDEKISQYERFSQSAGRISQCLAAEHRQIKDVSWVGQLQAAWKGRVTYLVVSPVQSFRS